MVANVCFAFHADSLHKAVLEHLLWTISLQMHEEKAMRALAHMLQHLFYLLGGVMARDLFYNGLAFEAV